MNNINKQWEEKEWNKMKEKLEKLSEKDLEILVSKLGIKFEGGVKSVEDRPGLSRREQLILVLDEADKDELKRKYEKINRV